MKEKREFVKYTNRKLLMHFSSSFRNSYVRSLIVIIIIIINHHLSDQIETQNDEKVKAMENTTIFQR